MKNAQTQNEPTDKKLTRLTHDKMIAGVASGIADYFDVDVNIIRLFFVLLTVFGGSGLLLYIILWILLPSEKSSGLTGRDMMRENVQEMKDAASEAVKEIQSHPKEKKEHSQFGIGVLIVIVGVVFLLHNLGIFDLIEIQKFWPLLLVFLGIYIVSKNEE